MIVIAGCGLNCAKTRAEQIRKSIVGKPAGTLQGDVAITISVGVASSCDWQALDGDGLIREADAALYHAKKEGRNRVAVARPDRIVCLVEATDDQEQAVHEKRN